MHKNQISRGVGSTGATKSALRSAGTCMSRVRDPPSAPWPDGGPKSLSTRCASAILSWSPSHFTCLPGMDGESSKCLRAPGDHLVVQEEEFTRHNP
ncbi:hypothetical protein PoB_000431600 [Plakobranchus ocellatus]|uniref:Uncharacterized protein n=1 Tax=Plakobranchus ocellatus TaxID=259542 RepID=A0AAV3XPY1_9GAST|nr:hypothetical protein PoB_000431600 [Plakobranchus ocellatus]